MSEDSDVLRVVGAVADKTQVTLYLEDGKTKIIKQGDLRLNKLLDEIIPITTAGKVAVVSLENLSVYQDFEKKSGGFIKFFKGAKKTIGKLFGGQGDEPEEIKLPPTPVIPAPQAPPVVPVQVQKPIPTHTVGESLQNARKDVVNQIAHRSPGAKSPEPIKEEIPPIPNPVIPTAKTPEPKGNLHKVQEHLKPMGDTDNLDDDETIVAVIGDMAIPDMEKLRPYIQHAVKANSVEGVTNFLKRIVPMIGKREHSIVDIMRFMEKGDLPLANDGSILAYKKLKTSGKTLVDCHSGKVTQRVGSYVCVDEKLVDKNRRNECSNGLHIGRRSYMGSFGGDTIVLTKVAPEDIVTVPHNDPNKVRVMGYHIIGMLSDKAKSSINSNRAMTDDNEASRMLARAIKGDHIERIEEVRIHGQYGADLVITPLIKGKRKEIIDSLTNAELSQGKAFDDPTSGLGGIDPKAINKKVNEQIEKSGMTAADTFKEVAKEAIPAPQSKIEEALRNDVLPVTIPETKAEEPKADPLPKAPGIKKAQAPKPQPAKAVDVVNNPGIAKFINTFSGANMEIANFAETAFKAGRNVYRALNGEREYKTFVANIADENLFNDEVKDIFTTFTNTKTVLNPPTNKGKEIMNEALKQGKKSPAKKPVPPKGTEKPASKAKAPAKTNSTKTAPAPKAEPVKASPKAAAKATSIAKATGPAKKPAAKPVAAKTEPKKETKAVSVKPDTSSAQTKAKAKVPASTVKADAPKVKPTSKAQSSKNTKK